MANNAKITRKLIEDYLFAEREPLRDEILELVEGEKPGLLQRKKGVSVNKMPSQSLTIFLKSSGKFSCGSKFFNLYKSCFIMR